MNARPIKKESIGEEIANAITHGVGALLSIAAIVILVVIAAIHGNAWHITGFAVFGATMFVLYLSSTLYHALTPENVKTLFRKFDHMSIFLLIAGTYTPFCLTALRGWAGWTILGVVWGCAIVGIVVKAFHTGKHEKLSTAMYVLMGWAVLPAIKLLYDSISFEAFFLLMTGGAFYTIGCYFFLKDYKKFYHSIWHLFVLGGSVSHFFAVMLLV